MSDEVKIPLPRSLQEIVGALLFASETPLTAGDLRAAVKAVEPEAGQRQTEWQGGYGFAIPAHEQGEGDAVHR